MPLLLAPSESVVWSTSITKGVFRRHKVESWIITNKRILIYNEVGGYLMEELPLSAITDIQVVNQSHQSNSSFMGSSTGGRSRYSGSRFMYGQSKSSSVVKGDVIILYDNGRPFTTFNQIVDPQSLVRLIRSLIAQQSASGGSL